MLVSAGNFHGQPLAFALDALAMAVAELASISERRVERLVNPNLSDGLPAFLTTDGGLNSGFMIPQYVAAALVSENKSLCHPASVDSIPTSAGQEDHVSMGNASGLKAWQVVANSRAGARDRVARRHTGGRVPRAARAGPRRSRDARVRQVVVAAPARRPVARARTSRRSQTRFATGRCSPPSSRRWVSSNEPSACSGGCRRRRRRSTRIATRCSSTARSRLLIVLVAWLTGGAVGKAAVIAVFFFVVASAWSIYRWRSRLRAEAAARAPGRPSFDRRRVDRRAGRVALRRSLRRSTRRTAAS